MVKPEGTLQASLKVAPVATSAFSEVLRVSGRIGFDEQTRGPHRRQRDRPRDGSLRHPGPGGQGGPGARPPA
ncbi:hypothetical protein ACU4GD_26065 [Cupriavidus basilensis]